MKELQAGIFLMRVAHSREGAVCSLERECREAVETHFKILPSTNLSYYNASNAAL